MHFRATLRTPEGTITTVDQYAENRFEAGKALKARSSAVLSIEEVVAPRTFSLPSFLGRVSAREKIIFARNLSAMLSAGMPLVRSLTALETQAPQGLFKTTLGAVLRSVDRGESLSVALGAHPKVFPGVFVAMVHAGEESGGLPNSLVIIADQLEKADVLRKKIRSAMVYPGIIMCAMVLVGLVMLVYVVPTLVATFKDLGVELPLSTRVLIGVSSFVSNNLIVFIALIGIFIFLIIKAIHTTTGKRSLDAFLVRVPGISPIVRQVNTAITARTLSSLISAGVDMVQSLSITATVHANTVYRDVLLSASKQVQSGSPLSTILKAESRAYPVLLASVTEVGEETGKLSLMLMNTALFYEEEVDRLTKNLSTIIEPVLMILIGGAVGFFSISMISPMYSVVDTL